MSRLVRQRRRENGDDNLLPLINVVFLLLIFFMVAGQLSATDTLAVEPPEAASAGEAGMRALTVYVAADGRLAVDEVLVELDVLAGEVAGRLEAEIEAGAEPVRIKADSAADSHLVVEVMERLGAAGVAEVRLMAVPERVP